jgi:hypothetical protein
MRGGCLGLGHSGGNAVQLIVRLRSVRRSIQEPDIQLRLPSAASRPCTNPLRGIGVVCGADPAPEPLTDEASKVGALPQTPPGAEPLDLNTYARFR